MDYSPSNSEQSLIAATAKIALLSQHWRCRHACTVKGGGQITSGYNRHRNSPFITFAHSTVHAEIQALRRHSNPARGYAISVRLDQAGNFAYAAPCPACRLALTEARIKRVIYSAPLSSSGFTELRL